MTFKPDDLNPNPINTDDPRFTAYALGELGEKESAEIKAALCNSPEAQRTVDGIRETARLLKQAMDDEPMVGLTENHRRTVEARIDESSQKVASAARSSRFRKVLWISSGLAASVLLVVSIVLPSLSRAREHSSNYDARARDHRQKNISNPGSVSNPGTFPASRSGVVYDQLTALGYSSGGRRGRASRRKRVVIYSADDRLEFATPVDGGLGGGGYAMWGANLRPGYHSADDVAALLRGRLGLELGSTESYAPIHENSFQRVAMRALSTFSIDVDTASYANMRRFLTAGRLPPPDAVRIEEFINYFSYDYPQPDDDTPFSVNVDVADCPWNPEHRLARIGLKGYEIADEDRPPSNLVFLIDVSGSMGFENKLPLLKQSLRMLVDELDEYDRVAIVVYAGASGLVLESTACDQKDTVLSALENLGAGGSTNGGAGIQLAYDVATENFIEGGTNRVILATDGDFNVGITSKGDLDSLITERAKTGVFLSVLGFGMGNYQDATLEQLADKGNGNYAYIDTLREARKVLVEQMGGTLVTIAKDVKIQVEFNPTVAAAYRLIGYENRILAKEDFNDDKKDAGEIGAGHTVTALYEIIPVGTELEAASIDPLKYQTVDPAAIYTGSDELMTVKVRYKLPDADESTKMEFPITDDGASIEDASEEFQFAAAVASFGMILRNSRYKGDATFETVLELAENSLNDYSNELRAEFIELIQTAAELASGANTTK